jgi:peptidoglycan/LPS O-acetylase OafA/YrhL
VKSFAQTAHISELTGLRALAVLMVLLDHSAGLFQTRFLFEFAPKLWIGVEIFFVLSGFLITRILLLAKGSQNYFPAFYMRRVLRIWPLYFCVLLAGFVLLYLNVDRHAANGLSPWPFILFIQNLQPISYLWRIKQLDVTWSLAVEEQFYLVWPVVVAIFAPKRLLWVCVGLMVISPWIRIMFVLASFEAPSLYYNTLCRIDGLAAGACLALCCYHGLHMNRFFRGLCLVLAAVGIPMTLAIVHTDAFLGNVTPWTVTVTALASFGLVGVAIQAAPESMFCRVLRNSILQYVGEVSYGLYLLHRFILNPLTNVGMQWIHNALAHDAIMLLMGFALCLLAASLSWYYMERPVLRLKQRFKFNRTVASNGGLSSRRQLSTLHLPARADR